MWSPSTSNPSTHDTPHLPWCSGLWSCSNLMGDPTILWLKWPVPLTTLLPLLKSSNTTTTMSDTVSSMQTDVLLSLRLSLRISDWIEFTTTWKPGASMNNSPTLRTASTSNANYKAGDPSPITLIIPTYVVTTALDQKVQSEREVMLLPKHMDELLM